jgi:hypothetical protein
MIRQVRQAARAGSVLLRWTASLQLRLQDSGSGDGIGCLSTTPYGKEAAIAAEEPIEELSVDDTDGLAAIICLEAWSQGTQVIFATPAE